MELTGRMAGCLPVAYCLKSPPYVVVVSSGPLGITSPPSRGRAGGFTGISLSMYCPRYSEDGLPPNHSASPSVLASYNSTIHYNASVLSCALRDIMTLYYSRSLGACKPQWGTLIAAGLTAGLNWVGATISLVTYEERYMVPSSNAPVGMTCPPLAGEAGSRLAKGIFLQQLPADECKQAF